MKRLKVAIHPTNCPVQKQTKIELQNWVHQTSIRFLLATTAQKATTSLLLLYNRVATRKMLRVHHVKRELPTRKFEKRF